MAFERKCFAGVPAPETFVTTTRDPDTIAAEAVELVVLLISREATASDAERIKAWRGRSPAHEAAFSDALRSMKGMQAAIREDLDEVEDERADVSRTGTFGRRALLVGGAAAGVAALATAPAGLWPSYAELAADYRTDKGERKTVDVAANVRLKLNTQTSIADRAGPDGPGLELVSGEVLVESRLGPGQRVSVMAANGVATASDARFNVLCINDGATITCLDGLVSVRRGDATATLGSGEQVAYVSGGLSTAKKVDAAGAAPWIDGLLIFKDRPLSEVVDEVNRYRTGRIVIVDRALGRRIVNGTFRIDQLQSFVAQIEQLFGARGTRVGALTLLS